VYIIIIILNIVKKMNDDNATKFNVEFSQKEEEEEV
jgi:hypothetical protein